jgi:hypothetical protein
VVNNTWVARGFGDVYRRAFSPSDPDRDLSFENVSQNAADEQTRNVRKTDRDKFQCKRRSIGQVREMRQLDTAGNFAEIK